MFSFLDKVEDFFRSKLSRWPVLYSIIGGIFIVLFWRGVWHTADIFEDMGGFWGWFFYEPTQVVISIIALLAVGLFVSFFVGDVIIISGIKKEKKLIEKTEDQIKLESNEVSLIKNEIDLIKIKLDEIKNKINNTNQK